MRLKKAGPERALLKEERGGAGLAIVLALLLFSFVFWYFFYPRVTPTLPQAPAPAAKQAAEPLAEPTMQEAPVASTQPGAPDSIPPDYLFSYKEALANGDLEGAVRVLRGSLRDAPEPSGVRQMLARDLNALALMKFEAGDYGSARELLSEAASVDPQPVYIENLANAHMRLGDLKAAAAALEPISGEKRTRKVLKGLYTRLGEQGYRNGDIKEAMEFFSKGLEVAPGDEYLTGMMAKIKAEYRVEGTMDSREGGHFLVKFEGGENATAGHLIGLLLEEAYLKVGSDLGFYPSDRIEALLYSRETFRDITRSPSWAGAIFDGRIKLPAGGIVEKTAELEAVIFHEYTHAVVHRLSGGRAPVWLNEGIAQYEEGKSSANPMDSELLKELARGGKLRLRVFEGSFMRLNPQGAYVAYLVSLSAVEHMIRDFGLGAVKRTLEGLGSGQSLDGAISSATFLSYEEFEKSWLESLKR